MLDDTVHGIRHRRVNIDATVQIMQGNTVTQTRVQDLSATGLQTDIPSDWQGHIDTTYILDIILDNGLQIHLIANLKRMHEHALGFEYAEIPESSQGPLWELLGEDSFSKERFR